MTEAAPRLFSVRVIPSIPPKSLLAQRLGRKRRKEKCRFEGIAQYLADRLRKEYDEVFSQRIAACSTNDILTWALLICISL